VGETGLRNGPPPRTIEESRGNRHPVGRVCCQASLKEGAASVLVEKKVISGKFRPILVWEGKAEERGNIEEKLRGGGPFPWRNTTGLFM